MLVGRSDVAQNNTVMPNTVVASASGFLFTLTDDHDPVNLAYRAEIAPGQSRVLTCGSIRRRTNKPARRMRSIVPFFD